MCRIRDAVTGGRTGYPPSPPISSSPMPPNVWHWPLPLHAEQDDSYPNALAAELSSVTIFPFPWQTAQFPSPDWSQSGQVLVAILHLPTVFAMLIWFHIPRRICTVSWSQPSGVMV